MKKEREKALVAAQEIHFAKALAANDKQLRDRALRRLNKWFTLKSNSSHELTEEGFMRIWKGLFYCVWMSDKPLIQEDTVESISLLLHCFTKFEDALAFIRCFYQAMSQAWFGLDQHRLDKYMMLVRRFVRQSFIYLRKSDWDLEKLGMFAEDLEKALVVAPVGFVMHLADVYIVELSKVGEGELKSEVVVELIRPWARLLATQNDLRLIGAIKEHVFLYLISQTDAALDHNARYEVWKNRGFPDGTIESIERVEASGSEDSEVDMEESEGEDEVFLDPRAGRADTVLPPVEFRAKDIINMLHTTKTSEGHNLVARQSKSIAFLIEKFKQLERGRYPLGLHRVPIIPNSDSEDEIDKAVERLSRFEDRVYAKSSGKKRKVNEPGKRRNSSGSVWDICENDREPAGISLTLSPHSLASSPWTVNEIANANETEGEAGGGGVPTKKRKLNKVIPVITPQQSPSNSIPAFKNASPSSLHTTPIHNIKKKSKSIMQNGTVNRSNNGEIEIMLTDLSTPNQSKLSPADKRKSKTPTNEKKVAFALSRNRAQNAEDYVKSVENSPSIPYEANKRPMQSVLKPSAIASPIHPFYLSKYRRQSKIK